MKFLSSPAVIALLLASAAALFFMAGCGGNYDGPTISRVGVTGSYTDKEGESFGGGIDADLAYPSPSPKPVHHVKPLVQKPLDPSK